MGWDICLGGQQGRWVGEGPPGRHGEGVRSPLGGGSLPCNVSLTYRVCFVSVGGYICRGGSGTLGGLVGARPPFLGGRRGGREGWAEPLQPPVPGRRRARHVAGRYGGGVAGGLRNEAGRHRTLGFQPGSYVIYLLYVGRPLAGLGLGCGYSGRSRAGRWGLLHPHPASFAGGG